MTHIVNDIKIEYGFNDDGSYNVYVKGDHKGPIGNILFDGPYVNGETYEAQFSAFSNITFESKTFIGVTGAIRYLVDAYDAGQNALHAPASEPDADYAAWVRVGDYLYVYGQECGVAGKYAIEVKEVHPNGAWGQIVGSSISKFFEWGRFVSIPRLNRG